MKGRVKRYIGMLAVFCLLLISRIPVLAAEASITYGSSSYTSTQGEEFQVGVYIRGSEAIGTYEFYLDYDSDKMEYVSGADSGGSGRLKFVGFGNSNSYSYMLTFKAVAAGSCNISISSANVGPLDSSSGDSMTISEASSAPVTIKGPNTTSDDCSLATLNLSPCGLYGFSPDVTEYDITVENELTEVSVKATTSSSKATYSVSDTNLKVGVNTVHITVTAENGATKTYSIIIRRKEGETPTTTTAQETPTTTSSSNIETAPEGIDSSVSFSVNGKNMYVMEVPGDNSVPEGFSRTTISYQEKEIPAYVGGTQNVTLLYMIDESNSNGGFYVYNEADQSVYPYITLTNAQGTYLLLSADSTVTIPEGYTATTVALAGSDSESVQTNVTAWVCNADAEFFLVYALNDKGETGFYQYDTVERTLQRYHAGGSKGTQGEEAEDMNELKEALVENKQESQKAAKIHFMIIIVLVILAIVLLFVIIGLVLKLRNMTEAEDVDYNKIEEDAAFANGKKNQTEEGTVKKQAENLKEKMPEEPFEQEEEEFALDDDFEFFDYDDGEDTK